LPWRLAGGFGGFGGFEGGQTAVLNPLKNRWQVPWRPAGGFGGFEGGQTAVLNPLKDRWQGHVVAVIRVVALEACGRVGSVWGV